MAQLIRSRSKLTAAPGAAAALEARWRELEEQLAAENRERAERAAAAAAERQQRRPEPAKAVVAPVALAVDLDSPPLRDRIPVVAWAGDVPVVLPDWLIPDDRFALVKAAMAGIRRAAAEKPGEARRRAVLLENALGVTMEDRTAAWAPVLALMEDIGSALTAEELKNRTAKWDVRQPRQKRAATKGQGKKGAAVKFSDGPTKERAAKSGLVSEVLLAVVTPEPKKGRRAPQPKTIEVGQVQRDPCADTRTRLERFDKLKPEQIDAGVRLATDWENSSLEPRMTANLMATGGGSSGDAWATGLSKRTMAARDEVHYALQALALGGPEVVVVVEAIVLRGETATAVGRQTYAERNKHRASANASTALGIGLALLARHYPMRARKLAAERTNRQQTA